MSDAESSNTPEDTNSNEEDKIGDDTSPISSAIATVDSKKTTKKKKKGKKKLGLPTEKSSKPESVVVHVRLRPFNSEESKKRHKSAIQVFDAENKSIVVKKDGDKKRFNFNNLLNQDVTQEEVFNTVGQRVIDGVLNGYNGTIFAYGMTGTGKTFSMLGKYNFGKELDSNEDRGIIPRSIEKIFDHSTEDESHDYSISVGFIQIYMEMIQDLLEPNNKLIKIREIPGKGVYIDNTTWIPVKNVQQAMKTFKYGEQNRATAFTNLNAHSSRSHAVLLVKIEKRKASIKSNDRNMTFSTLYLVDLAGSERVKKSKATAGRLDEAKKINYSLSCLGKCIEALSEQKRKMGHIPFRDSKLTRLLQDSLGGNSKTSMIVNIGPSNHHADETVMSLNFGFRAMKIENKPSVNKKVDHQALCGQLQAELDSKNDIITELEIQVNTLEEQVKSLQAENDELKMYKEADDTTTSNTQEEVKDEKPKIDLSEVEAMNQDLLKKKEQEFQKKFKEYKAKFKKMHAEIMVKKEKEYKAILEDADKLIFEQEKEIESLQTKIKDSEAEVTDLEETKQELEKEKEDLNTRIIEVSQENDELKSSLESQTTSFESYKQKIAEEVDLAHKEHENKLKKLKKKYILDKSNKIKEIDREWTIKWEKKKNELELLSIKKEIEDFFIGFEKDQDGFKPEIRNSCLRLVNQFYNQQDQQNTVINLKSQLKQIERENTKLKNTIEDLTDENDNLVKRIEQIEAQLEDKRNENDQEAKEIEYDNEQRKIMDSYENLLKSKDITIKSLEQKLTKVEDRIKLRMSLKQSSQDEGIVMLKNKQALLSNEILKNVQDSLIKCTSDPHVNLPVGKMNITNILYHLNHDLFSNCFKDQEISYKELHPLSNEIFSFFIDNKFPSAYMEYDTTPGGGRRKNSSYASAFGKLDIDELSISKQDGEDLKLSTDDQSKVLSILYAIVFSHFVESQMKLQSSKEAIRILEDKVQELKDNFEIELRSRASLQDELRQTQKEMKTSKNQALLQATRIIQKYWRRFINQRRSKILLQERIQKLKEIQENENRRRSLLTPHNKTTPQINTTSPQIVETFETENSKKEQASNNYQAAEELKLPENQDQPHINPNPKPSLQNSPQNSIDQDDSCNSSLSPDEDFGTLSQQFTLPAATEVDIVKIHEEERKEFADELNEEEHEYLQNTGKFFILDSMRQMDNLFVDLYHGFVESKIKKGTGSIFSRKDSDE
ncbi:unnamed protein product [Moneuplotes crassus]|uniref:Kinesin motor domain-containing protein n=1 Tax=Euplotes crassus TaxID=5936 RepID=A0AAD1URH5_EUPCR|nr:unnamed protein product [Moneuplotes crassus]